ncbi:hypothetical protein [Streptomyces sp. NPDC101181]|uniref:hypothetical protein n=1 Tax=Streptomyces sp. NPDC101181 TaxID=3366125 RepID=UPI00382AFE80
MSRWNGPLARRRSADSSRTRRQRAARERTEPDTRTGTGQSPRVLVENHGGLLLLRLPTDDTLHPADVADLARTLGADEDGTVTIVAIATGEAAAALWPRLSETLDSLRDEGTPSVRLVMSGAGADRPDRPALARHIADAWKMTVEAPDGPVLVVPGGSVFVPPGHGGWRRFVPGGQPEDLGPRTPAPGWQAALRRVPARTEGGCVVDQIPAGLVIRPAGAGAPRPGDLFHAIPVDPGHPAVVVGVPWGEDLVAGDVAELLAALPAVVRRRVRLAPGGRRDLLPIGQSVAGLLNAEIEVTTGLPLIATHQPLGRFGIRSVLAGPDGDPRWLPFVDAVVCAPPAEPTTAATAEGEPGPAGAVRPAPPAPRLVRWSAPAPELGLSEQGVARLSDAWQAVATRAGLWVGPSGAAAPRIARPVSVEGPVVEIGRGGDRVDASLWPLLSGLLGRLAPDIRSRTTLHVHALTPDGGLALRGLAAEHALRMISFAAAPATRPARRDPAPATAGAGARGGSVGPARPALRSAPPAPVPAEDAEARTGSAAPVPAPIPRQTPPAPAPRPAATASGPTASAPMASGPMASAPMASGPMASAATASAATDPTPTASVPTASGPTASGGPSAPLPPKPKPKSEPEPEPEHEHEPAETTSTSSDEDTVRHKPARARQTATSGASDRTPLPTSSSRAATPPTPPVAPVPAPEAEAAATATSGPAATTPPAPVTSAATPPAPGGQPPAEPVPVRDDVAPSPPAPAPSMRPAGLSSVPLASGSGGSGDERPDRPGAGTGTPEARRSVTESGAPETDAPPAPVPDAPHSKPVPTGAPSERTARPVPDGTGGTASGPDPARAEPAPRTRAGAATTRAAATAPAAPAARDTPVGLSAAGPASAPASPARRRPLPPVPVGPQHSSTPAERMALRKLAESAWERHSAAVNRALAEMPALRGAEQETARTDLVALRMYLENGEGPLGHRALAESLRSGEQRLVPYAACIASALARLPSYRGVVLRGLGGATDLTGVRAGDVVRDAAPVSGTPLDPAGKQRVAGAGFAIWSTTGRRVRRLLDGGDQIVFAPGSAYRVLAVRTEGSGPLILLRQIRSPETASALLEDADETALERLNHALTNRTSPGAGNWPDRCAGPLGGIGAP